MTKCYNEYLCDKFANMKCFVFSKKTTIIYSLSFGLLAFLSACEKYDMSLRGLPEESHNSKVRMFIKSLSSVDPKNRIPMIEDFELHNNIELTNHPAITEDLSVNSSEVTEIAPIFPESRKVGGGSDSSGSHVGWTVVENYFGWWQ